MAGNRAKGRGLTRILAVVAVLAVVAALVLAALPDQEKKYVTASFPRTVSLYEGSDVRILGVPVGKVESVQPSGTDVTVKMWYDAKYDVPKDAQAVIISPAIVGDRFVQLTPVFKQGDTPLGSHAVMSTKSTSTPLELDEIYQSIDDLTVALGPNGANRQGALTNLLNSTAKNFAGQGEQFHRTIKNLGKFTGTLDDNKEELFGTAREIERFVNALARNDGTVRRLQRLARLGRGPAQGRALRPGRRPAQPGRRDEGRGELRPGEPHLALAEHQGAEQGVQGAGQAA